ncbi:U7 snRNA-associated Sm-like protein LSm10 [Procambarus clarkii]|uniref:U7 snRNA-associated Sm-like protein LSm10 n=1 Tax=Procambarus clarkii TaxID=6728 RepID=UPI001E6761F3|nr:U7 snRNA-associated Sm-like protein LSm10 [Procambarus clarkii]XP_045604648.1 U7 snRNA-associated Sm-like protein LSm10 [Procambarus clarkii]XP_045604649.1 U7 snRNA-associated Sm-like protein LSm10 [Procambarus clarkii]XP_045604650.1 U7 snRNA-associated Sm-like protein LSm10 [Procambarus clarkii]XP_045604651.1 U7 snRNA-associated Sm-like protein LSm10 [Procambarus clarkii]
MGLDGRSRHKELNTLTCLVMGLTGWRTTVELHNDAFVSGLITEVDVKMNMEIANARYTDVNGKSILLENFHVMGRKIRYVHIPDKIDIMELIKKRVTFSAPRQKMRLKGLIAEKRTEQTLKRYRREHGMQCTKQDDEDKAGPSQDPLE